ncbi:MAG: hypothetical protein AAGA77_05465 [Bacteroidota bacterium]
MKYFLITMISLLSTACFYAQDVELIEGEEFKDGRTILFTAPHNDGFVVLSVDGYRMEEDDVNHDADILDDNGQRYMDGDKKVFITQLNSKLAIDKIEKIQREKSQALPEIKAEKFSLYALENIGGKLFMYYTKYSKSAKKTEHCVMEINVDKPILSKETVLNVDEFGKKKSRSLFLKNTDASIVVFATKPHGKKNDNCMIKVVAYSTADHSELWMQMYDTGRKRNQVIFNEIHLAQNGTLFIGYQNYRKNKKTRSYLSKESKESKERRPFYKQCVAALRDEETLYTELKLDQYFPYKCDFQTIENNLIICGTYTTQYKGNLRGIYSWIVDQETFAVSEPRLQDFSDDLLNQMDDEDIGTAKAKDPGIKSYLGLGTIMQEGEGNIKYIYEPYREKRRTSAMDQGMMHQYVYYITKSIIVADISEEISFSTIPRSVRFESDFSAIQSKLLKTDKGAYLLYLDHIENMIGMKKRKKDFKLKELRNSKAGVLAMARFDSNNSITRKVLRKLENENFYFNPSYTARVGAGEFMLTGVNDGILKSRKQKNLLLKL